MSAATSVIVRAVVVRFTPARAGRHAADVQQHASDQSLFLNQWKRQPVRLR